MMKHLLNTAITAALEAGKAILEIYHSGEFDVEIKGELTFNQSRYGLTQCDYILPKRDQHTYSF
jgi:hypothetical protein